MNNRGASSSTQTIGPVSYGNDEARVTQSSWGKSIAGLTGGCKCGTCILLFPEANFIKHGANQAEQLGLIW